ncbi:BLOC-1-related complex subunit 5 [Lepeophtheirus salmonis]|uniref:BLOC-1-related complex subunit 5 n=1 Tax=Lepeophtheirus salmonis TaxID=72036 RepID=UPI001AE4A56A|nr:BLOC-1-related complex subunit 5-like [Lepeophtheirus salmonis]
MGSEQSQLRSKSKDGDGSNRASSPLRQESVSSEVEAPPPYVPYTVGRPIGSECIAQNICSKKSPPKRTWIDSDTMITLNNSRDEYDQEDEEIRRLENVSSFLPIMRGSSRDPDILERLDVRGFNALVQRYSNHLRYTSKIIKDTQSEINKSIKETEALSASVLDQMNKNSSSYSKYAEKLAKASDMSRALNKCHSSLNENIERMEVLNNMLPMEERLEPFVWTTG